MARGWKCRCYICGAKNADSNHVRNSYIRVGITMDEHGFIEQTKTKAESRRLRRTRENRIWRGEISC